VTQTLAAVIHGESGAGKSYFGGTAPGPRLILDAEGGSRFIRSNKRRTTWSPLTEPPPEADGTWDACFVNVFDWKEIYAAYQWLASGKHGFKSVIIDSLTEAQKRLVDDVAGVDQPTLQDWGTIGRHFEDVIRKFRDLTLHKTNPVNVIMICLSHLRDGETRPFLKGQLELSLPAFVDVVGFLYTQQSQTEGNKLDRLMLISPANKIIAKDRTAVLTDQYGLVVPEPDFGNWLDLLEAEFGD
jgi:hypothetical protein